MSDTEQGGSPKVEAQPEFVEDRAPSTVEVAKVEDVASPVEEISKRLFVRPINHDTTMEEVEKLFTELGSVTDISLKPGYGFIEYENLSDADKAIETFNGNSSLGYQIMVERAMARGARRGGEAGERPARPVATHRILISGVTEEFSWQDLKDLSRDQGVEAVFTKVDQGNVGVIDVASDGDRDALKQLKEWKGSVVEINEDPRGPAPPPRGGRGGRGGRGSGRFGDRRGGPRFGGYRGDRGDRGDRGGDRFGGDRRGGDRYGDRRYGDRSDRRSFGDRRSGGDRSDRRARSRSPPRRSEEASW